jgi:hypothetical protein
MNIFEGASTYTSEFFLSLNRREQVLPKRPWFFHQITRLHPVSRLSCRVTVMRAWILPSYYCRWRKKKYSTSKKLFRENGKRPHHTTDIPLLLKRKTLLRMLETTINKSRNTSNSMMMMMMMMMLVVVEVVNFQTSIRVSSSGRIRRTEICYNRKAEVLTKQQIKKN